MIKSLKNCEPVIKRYKSSKTQSEKNEIAMFFFQIVYFDVERMGVTFYDEDEKNDFALFFYDKIHILIEKYNFELSKFYTYFINYIKFSALTFKRKKRQKCVLESYIVSEEIKQINVSLDEFQINYFDDTDNINIVTEKITNSNSLFTADMYFKLPCKNRKLLLLACKSCLFLNDKMTYKIAKTINLEKHIMFNLIGDLRFSCIEKIEKLNTLTYKRNLYYKRMKIIESFLELNEKNTDTVKYLKYSFEYNQKQWLKSINTIKKITPTPSRMDMEKYLKIKRDTIDKNIANTLKNGSSLWTNLKEA